MLTSRARRNVGQLPGLSELAPAGVCDAPNPWIYAQLARLCGEPIEGAAPSTHAAEGASHPGAAEYPHHFDIDDPDTRPYLWDLKEDDCKCR